MLHGCCTVWFTFTLWTQKNNLLLSLSSHTLESELDYSTITWCFQLSQSIVNTHSHWNKHSHMRKINLAANDSLLFSCFFFSLMNTIIKLPLVYTCRLGYDFARFQSELFSSLLLSRKTWRVDPLTLLNRRQLVFQGELWSEKKTITFDEVSCIYRDDRNNFTLYNNLPRFLCLLYSFHTNFYFFIQVNTYSTESELDCSCTETSTTEMSLLYSLAIALSHTHADHTRSDETTVKLISRVCACLAVSLQNTPVATPCVSQSN